MAVLLGSIWAAVPTPFAAELLEAHELGKLGWLLGGQIGALAIGAWCLLAARSVVWLSDRLLPASWQSRALYLALSMLVMVGGSLVSLGLPFLQAPWWLALSLGSYTLASAVWSMLLPRLRLGLSMIVCAQRHLMPGQGMGLPNSVQLAHERAQEKLITRLLATAEGILIAVLAPVMGWLIDFYGSVDRVLVIVGQCFLLGLTLSALVCVLRNGQQHQPPQVARMALHKLARNSIQMRYSSPSGVLTARSRDDTYGRCANLATTCWIFPRDNHVGATLPRMKTPFSEEMRNEICLSNEAALDRSWSHPWFLR